VKTVAKDEGAPVLVLAYRRVDALEQTLQALRLSSPISVYVSVDGPRGDRSGEDREVEQVREFLESFEFTCPFHLRYNETNRGLGEGVCEAIGWFFAHEKSGVILEDDVYIEPSSLGLAGRLLSEFKDDRRVGSISLFNPVPPTAQHEPRATYRFSHIPSSQYWGTWRDRWQVCTELQSPKQVRLSRRHLTELGGDSFARMYLDGWNRATSIERVSWEGRWLATHFSHNWVVPTTNQNFSLHLGFNSRASNSVEQPSWYPTELATWDGSLTAPATIEVDRRADRWYLDRRFGLSAKMRWRRAIRRSFPWLATFWRRRTVKAIHAPVQGEGRDSQESP
jgi:hypothetical protein